MQEFLWASRRQLLGRKLTMRRKLRKCHCLHARDYLIPSHRQLFSYGPIWGSILDDVWAIDECDAADDPPRTAGLAHEWMQDMATAWGKDGVVEHVKKAVSGVRKEEVHG